MSLPVAPMPDVEQAIIDYLAGILDAGITVGSEWPEKLAEHLPVVAVSLGGGGTRQRAVTVDRTLDIDVLAPTKAAARDLAATVSAHLIAAQGTTQGPAQIYDVTETNTIWLPDQVTGLPRYVLVISMGVRPA